MSWLKRLAARLRPDKSGISLSSAALLRNLLPLTALATVITALVLAVMWQRNASYKPVFGERENVAAADMMSALEDAGIAYRLHPQTGQVLVPERRVREARMLLAARGVVAKLPAGLEIMDRKDPLGVSQFVQDVRFRRGLEGELAQSIMTLDAVEFARVHLSIAKSTSFVVDDGTHSTASVVVTLKPGRHLSDEQIAAIVNMVAGSTAGLEPQHVTLVDQGGSLLSARLDLSEGFAAAGGNEAARTYQEETRRNIRELLAPVLGLENFMASVTAEVDNDRIRETREQYGDTPRITNEAVREEVDNDRLALGVPGSLSNRPIETNAEAEPEGGTQAQRNAATRQYAYDRSITEIQRSRGRLTRLSVAVVVNSAAAPGGGEWSPEALGDIDRLLRSGLGIDAARGDTLVVSALPFPAATVAPSPWWQQRETLLDFVPPLLYLVTMLLAFLFVVRPLVKALQRRLAPLAAGPQEVTATVANAGALPGAAAATPAAQLAAAQPTPAVGPLLEEYELPPAGSPVDVMVDHLKALAEKEPERVAEVVKQWVQKHVRSD